MLIRQNMNRLSRPAASVALALFVAMAAPVTAQALSPAALPGLGSNFATAQKQTSTSKKSSSSKKTTSKPKPTSVKTVLSPIQSQGLPTTSATTSTIKTILKIVFGIIGAFALLNVVASGLKYITSGGDPGKTGEAKKGIIFALVGLAIAVSAEAIVAYVIKNGAPG